VGTIHNVGAVVIENDTFLLVRQFGRDVWTSLGGHLEAGESEEEALKREIREELGCAGDIVRKLGDFRAKAAHDDAEVVLATFLVRLIGDPAITDPEIEELRFIGPDFERQGILLPESITHGVLPYCIRSGLLHW